MKIDAIGVKEVFTQFFLGVQLALFQIMAWRRASDKPYSKPLVG